MPNFPQPEAATSIQVLSPSAAPESAPWNVVTRVAFRFWFVYFGLYVLFTQMFGALLPLPIGFIPQPGRREWSHAVVAWAASHVFHVTGPLVFFSGSGDKTFDWVQAFCFLVVAAVATLAWSVLDPARLAYRRLHGRFHVLLRFALGATMVGYGMSKAIPLQMPAPPLTRLLEPFGNFSPMGVLWYSVGASFPYERFAGCMELTAAVLLFIPRLSTLGAMVLVADSIQIFTLNMTYDVPVKLFSFHLILMGLVLLAPEMRRLLNVLVLNRPAGPSSMPPLARRRGVQRT